MTRPIAITDLVRAVLVLVGVLAQVIVGFFPGLFGIEGSIASRSAESETLLVPAGIAFAIWGPLYLGSFMFAIAHALPPLLRHRLTARVGWCAAAAYWGNTAWAIYTPVRGPDWVSFFILECVLAALLTALYFINRARPFAMEWGVLFFPIFALAGWLTIASAAGFSLTANYTGLNPWALNAVSASLSVLAVWLVIVLGLVVWARSFSYTAPILWGLGFVTIAAMEKSAPLIALGSAVAGGLILVALLVSRFRRA